MSTTTDAVALGRRAAPVARPARPTARRAGGQLVLHAAFVVACLATLFPLAWMLRTAVIGLGVNTEVGIGPFKVAALPKFRVAFTNSTDPSLP